jgi:hypothetical protein
MKKDEQEKMWDAICNDVAKNVEQTYLSIPQGKRNQLGVEPDKTGKFPDPDAYDRNRWVVCYISLLEWQRKARVLFNQQHVFSEEEDT